VDALLLLAGEHIAMGSDKGYKLAKEALKISEEENYNDGRALSYLCFAMFEKDKALVKKNFDKGFEYVLLSSDVSVHKRAVGIMKMLFEDDYTVKMPDYLERMIPAAKKFNDPKLLGKIYREKAYSHYTEGDFNKAIDLFKLALVQFKRANMGSDIAGMTMNIGVIYFKTSQLDSSLKFYREAQAYFAGNKDLKNEANTITNIALTLEKMGKTEDALSLLETAVKKYKQSKEDALLAGAFENIGTLYEGRQDQTKAIEYIFKAVAIREKMKDTMQLSFSYTNLAQIYYNLNNFARSEFYARKAIQLAQMSHNKEILATGYANMGFLAEKKNQPDSVLYFQLVALKLREEMGMEIQVAESYYNLAEYYYDQNMNAKAEENYRRAVELSERNKDFEKLPKYQIGLARALMFTNQFNAALPLLKKAEKYLLESKRQEIKQVYESMSLCYNKTGNFKEAYRYLNLCKHISDSLADEEKGRVNAEMLEKYETDKKQKEISILTKDKELKHLQNLQQQERLDQQNKYLLIALGVLLVISFLAFFLFKSNREKKQANQIILAQKKEVEQQREIVTEKNNEIIDSIQYAKKIQDVLLVNQSVIANHFPEHFILFKPKDIVSGDFYQGYMIERRTEKEGGGSSHLSVSSLSRSSFYLVVGDSTGHGVPGAFMSLLNMSFFNEAIKERSIAEPDKILNYVRGRLVETVSKDGAQDGMDGVIICYNKATKKLTYAAAHNAPIVIREGKVLASSSDKMPVGKGVRNEPFTLFEIEIQKDDMIYLVTDGFQDQFGGEKGKKFMSKKFRELLAANSYESLQKQKETLENEFKTWTGNNSQVDDVTVIGIRI
jgi:serine phosphatase RsbU (regulator of sigma subunit)